MINSFAHIWEGLLEPQGLGAPISLFGDPGASITTHADFVSVLGTEITGNFMSRSTGNTGDHYIYVTLTGNTPAINGWVEGAPLTFGFSGDGPCVLYFEALDPAQGQGVQVGTGSWANGTFSVSYGQLRPSLGPGLAFGTHPNASDSSVSYYWEAYTNGAMIYVYGSGAPRPLCLFINTFGEIFFCFLGATDAGSNYITGVNTKTRTHYDLVNGIVRGGIYGFSAKPQMVSGTVKDVLGQPAAGCPVFLYQRSTGNLISKGVTDSAGGYSLYHPGMPMTCFLVVLDDEVAPDFAPIIVDRINVEFT